MITDLEKLERLLRNHPDAGMRASLFWRDYDKVPKEGDSFLLLYSAALKRLGKAKVTWSASDAAFIGDAYTPFFCELSLGMLARILLVLRFGTPSDINEILLRGDDNERSATLLCLSFCNAPEQYLEQVINCTRSNSEIVFRALAQQNAYPSLFFENRQFFHLVLKCIFLGMNIEKIVGLRDRYTKDFGRMLADFYNERTSAGRKLPEEVTQFMKEKALL